MTHESSIQAPETFTMIHTSPATGGRPLPEVMGEIERVRPFLSWTMILSEKTSLTVTALGNSSLLGAMAQDCV